MREREESGQRQDENELSVLVRVFVLSRLLSRGFGGSFTLDLGLELLVCFIEECV